jgi:hypothetical protein
VVLAWRCPSPWASGLLLRQLLPLLLQLLLQLLVLRALLLLQ